MILAQLLITAYSLWHRKQPSPMNSNKLSQSCTFTSNWVKYSLTRLICLVQRVIIGLHFASYLSLLSCRPLLLQWWPLHPNGLQGTYVPIFLVLSEGLWWCGRMIPIGGILHTPSPTAIPVQTKSPSCVTPTLLDNERIIVYVPTISLIAVVKESLAKVRISCAMYSAQQAVDEKEHTTSQHGERARPRSWLRPCVLVMELTTTMYAPLSVTDFPTPWRILANKLDGPVVTEKLRQLPWYLMLKGTIQAGSHGRTQKGII